MSLTADLALVTACQDALDQGHPAWLLLARPLVLPALSLIEDTLNEDAPSSLFSTDRYDRALTALHTIATALGVDRAAALAAPVEPHAFEPQEATWSLCRVCNQTLGKDHHTNAATYPAPPVEQPPAHEHRCLGLHTSNEPCVPDV